MLGAGLVLVLRAWGRLSVSEGHVQPPAACHWVLVTDAVGSSVGKVPGGLSPDPLGSNEQSAWLALELQEVGKDCLGGDPQKDAQKGSRKTSCSREKVQLRYSSPFI